VSERGLATALLGGGSDEAARLLAGGSVRTGFVGAFEGSAASTLAGAALVVGASSGPSVTACTVGGRTLSGMNSGPSGGPDSTLGDQPVPSTGIEPLHRLHLIVVARPAKRLANSASGMRKLAPHVGQETGNAILGPGEYTLSPVGTQDGRSALIAM
jgi:hypothetical protein